MQVIHTNVMRGPNYWCPNRHKLIVMSIALDESEFLSTDAINRILAGKTAMFPYSRRCQPFTTLVELTGQLVLELQALVGMDCAYFKVHGTCNPNRFYLVYSYGAEVSGLYAGDLAVRIAAALKNQQPFSLAPELEELKRLYQNAQLGPSTRAIVAEAQKRSIPFRRLDKHSLIQLGHGCNQRTFRATVASTTNSLAVEQVSDKDGTKRILAENHIPVPKGTVITKKTSIVHCMDTLKFPLVVKPLDGNHGRGITTYITNQEQLEEAFDYAKKYSEEVIVEQHINGCDYRFLLVDFKLVAVAKRLPARVTGDGRSSIRTLVEQVNKDPRRGLGHEKELTIIRLDDATLSRLSTLGYSAEDVLPAKQVLHLKDTANISTGGTAEDVTDLVHPDNVFLAERVARLMDLDICGIDIMTPDVAQPITATKGAVLEVNAGPGLRMHLAPTVGKGRNVAAPILDMLYPPESTSRIPIVAVTGTNGKTTTTRLIAHLVKAAGFKVGFTTTEGIYIDGHLVTAGDCSGPSSATTVLRDPLVEFAVLECARGGILRSGLGFDECSVSIVTNIASDHLGLKDIETVEQLAKVKRVVPASTSTKGCAILNADDDLVFQMQEGLQCKVALFSLDINNPRIVDHVRTGGLAASIENGHFVIIDQQQHIPVASVSEVPLSHNGQSECMMMNIMPALLTAHLYKFPITIIKDALAAFTPSAEHTPGRMNVFKIRDITLLVDYAHNESGYLELKKYAAQVTASRKTGIIACPGDRRREDIVAMGRCAAGIFDQLIIRHDEEYRGRANEEITALLMEGIQSVDPGKPVKVISNELDALDDALEHAIAQEWIFFNPEHVMDTLQYVEEINAQYAIS
jgi:cyanophycin synthetase